MYTALKYVVRGITETYARSSIWYWPVFDEKNENIVLDLSYTCSSLQLPAEI
jgi:hypothetical protein